MRDQEEANTEIRKIKKMVEEKTFYNCDVIKCKDTGQHVCYKDTQLNSQGTIPGSHFFTS